MAEATPDNSACKLTVDDLFQILIARGIPPPRAKEKIWEALQRGPLRIDSHVAAGVRKTSPTPEGHKAAIEGRPADVTYEVSPPEGITAPVDPQSWDGIFYLEIKAGRLTIEPRYSQVFPESAYSYSIANPVVIDHLWPPPTQSLPSPPTGDEGRPPADATKVTQLKWAYGESLKTGELTGLRGKALRDVVCRKIGPKFTAGQRTFEMALQLYRREHAS